MSSFRLTRRSFMRLAGAATGTTLLSAPEFLTRSARTHGQQALAPTDPPADYTLTIATKPIELAPNRIVSVTTYNGQFPGPLLRLKEGQRVTIDVHNATDTPEQLHWHGQFLSPDVDGAAEEGTPFIPPHGSRRLSFVPKPSGFRFYHTHVRAGADLAAGQYSGLVGPVYIEPKQHPGNYDREVFLTLKEFQPTFSRGGDMAMDFLSPAQTVAALKNPGESSMNASLARGMPHGFEVGYDSFTINGRTLGHGEPVRVKQGERVLFHVLNGSAGEIRSLALPGHTFTIVAMDGNSLPRPVRTPGLWIGTAERISAIVEMNYPGVWIMGDLADDDRHHGMGIVVEYSGHQGKPQWIPPMPFKWNYARFANPGSPTAQPDQVFDLLFEKQNAALDGFNQWTINGVAYPSDQRMAQMMAKPSLHLQQGKRYRLRMRNASDDIHPIHLHRHSFELTRIAGQPCSGLIKDVVMVGGYQEAEIDFVTDNPGLTLFHCHQQLHMDFGFMTLFDYV
jgi:FtsP/CotA-like multicopper oxidase with cupredoxin domain